MTVDCETCFNKRYYPPKAIESVCNFCKEKNWKCYRPDLTDIKGPVTVVKELKE